MTQDKDALNLTSPELDDAWRKFEAKEAAKAGEAKARKVREKAVPKVDGRSLRATGRTKTYTFRVKPDVLKTIQTRAKRSNISIAAYIEVLVLADAGKPEKLK